MERLQFLFCNVLTANEKMRQRKNFNDNSLKLRRRFFNEGSPFRPFPRDFIPSSVIFKLKIWDFELKKRYFEKVRLTSCKVGIILKAWESWRIPIEVIFLQKLKLSLMLLRQISFLMPSLREIIPLSVILDSLLTLILIRKRKGYWLELNSNRWVVPVIFGRPAVRVFRLWSPVTFLR